MKLQELNKRIQSNLRTSDIIKNNLNSNLMLVEKLNIGISGKLQSVNITNIPMSNCWLFEHENPEKQFETTTRKVEKTILYLDETKKELLVVLVEMKSTFGIRELFQCQEKLSDSLTHLSIFLAINNHSILKYDDYKIKFKFSIFYNSENIVMSHPRINEPLTQDFVSFRKGDIKTFNIEINSPSLGFNLIPTIGILNQDQENISIEFQDLLNLFV